MKIKTEIRHFFGGQAFTWSSWLYPWIALVIKLIFLEEGVTFVKLCTCKTKGNTKMFFKNSQRPYFARQVQVHMPVLDTSPTPLHMVVEAGSKCLKSLCSLLYSVQESWSRIIQGVKVEADKVITGIYKSIGQIKRHRSKTTRNMKWRNYGLVTYKTFDKTLLLDKETI